MTLTHKLIYIVTEEVGLKTNGLAGILTLHADHMHIAGPKVLSLPYSQLTQLRVIKQHKVGTLIHLRCSGTSVFLAVQRFNLLGILAVINRGKTHALFKEL